MKTENRNICDVPAVIYGEKADKVYLFVHGKMGCKEEAEDFAKIVCPFGFQVVGIDLPEHGSRKNSKEKLLPWIVTEEIQKVYQYMKEKWSCIRLTANSIGAWLSMLALKDEPIEKAFFVSPIVDMENLIKNMLSWAGCDEEELKEKGEIPTDFGETLSWEYLCYVRTHPISWTVPTEILYAENDNMTSKSVMDSFVKRSGAVLTVMKNGEHWFHTEEQLAFLHGWEKEKAIN